MGLIEQYDKEIQEQKGLSEKLETSNRWLRDAKQGKLVNKSTMKGMERIVPEGVTYTPWVEAYSKTTALINHIQADFEYLESLGEGKQELEKGNQREDLNNVQKIRWTGENYRVLVALFELLFGAKLIDGKSFKNTAALMAHHFTNNGSEISAEGVRQYRNKYYKDHKKELIDNLFHLLDDAAGNLS